MSYAIICDARRGGGLGIETLALVDRAKTKKLWWTSDDTFLILKYLKLSAAQFALSRLKRNNARIVPYSDAVELIHEQSMEIEHNEIMDGLELGWDGHKDVF